MGNIDPSLIDAIKGFEGYSATPAWDYKQNSSGYGTVAQPGDTNIPPDQLKAIHEQRLQTEVARAADAVDNVNPDLPPGARNALISLTYNAGPGWAKSGLGDAVRAGDMEAAKTHFLQYNKAGGEVNPGLVSRRAQEAAWFGGAMPQGQAKTAQAASGGLLKSLLGSQAAPIFPQQAQAAPQEMAAAAPSPLEQIPAAQAPPIFYASRKPINLSALRAAFSGYPKG